MANAQLLVVLRRMLKGLENLDVKWAVGGSLSLALRGASIHPRDIDILTDKNGAYEIEDIFSEFVKDKVSLRTSENIQSYFGTLEMDGIKMEIMGDFQLRDSSGRWDGPVDLRAKTEFIMIEELQVPVLSLEWEYEAYSKLGRYDRVAIISRLMKRSNVGLA